MVTIEYIVAPLIGGIIGYITNDIAIRMLFRPHTAKYVLGIHVPFTPGIIPKEKGRIAAAIGEVISDNLMNQEVMQRYLLSNEMIHTVRLSVHEFFEQQKQNEETLEQFLTHYLSQEEVATISRNVCNDISVRMGYELRNPKLGAQIASLVMRYLTNRLNRNEAQEIYDGLGGMLGGIGGGLRDAIMGRILDLLREPTERFLRDRINEVLRDKGENIVSNLVQDESRKLLSTPISILLSDEDEQLAQLENAIESIYRRFIEDSLPSALQAIDISKIVRERINEMDVNETEKLIMKVMNKELKAIVWLGALLGLIMGSINIFV